MQRRVRTSVTAIALVAACAGGCSDAADGGRKPAPAGSTVRAGDTTPGDKAPTSGSTPTPSAVGLPVVDAAKLRAMLLTSAELGDRFTATAGSDDGHATKITGCRALDTAVGGEATAKALDLPLASEAEGTFRSSYSPIELTERLGSDTATRLDAASAPIEALAECGSATFANAHGDTLVTVTKRPANVKDAQGSSYTMTVSGQRIQLTVLRMGPILMSLSGDPALVDGLLPAAVAKVATATKR